jgi:uncharacterized protein (TIGR00295 family)
MNLPPVSRRSAYQRLAAASPPAWVLEHCVAVEGLATAMAERANEHGLDVDVPLVQAGALLHDIGRSITQDVRHASEGARLLRAEAQWPPPLVAVVERHTGAGIDATEAAALGLPVQDYTPRTLEERIVAHADNLYSGSKRLQLAEVEAKYRSRGLEHAGRRIRALHRQLSAELGVDLEDLKPASLPHPADA